MSQTPLARITGLTLLAVLAGCGPALPGEDEAPSFGRQQQASTAGVWDICYLSTENTNNLVATETGATYVMEDEWSWCAEQWGSYAYACDQGSDSPTTKRSDARCKNIGMGPRASGTSWTFKGYVCRYGTLSHYDSRMSNDYNMADTYDCDEGDSGNIAIKNLSIVRSGTNNATFTPNYTFWQAHGAPEGRSIFEWYWSSSPSTIYDTEQYIAQETHTNDTLTLCARPVGDSIFWDGYGKDAYSSFTSNYSWYALTNRFPLYNPSSWALQLDAYWGVGDSDETTCVSWSNLTVNGVPSYPQAATNVSADVSADHVHGKYTYNLGDSTTGRANLTEAVRGENVWYGQGLNHSSYTWYRSATGSTADATTIKDTLANDSGLDLNHPLVADDENQYLKFCVTEETSSTFGSLSTQNSPARAEDYVGAEACSGWSSVGPLAKFYSDASYGGDDLYVAFKNSTESTCFNFQNMSFKDALSSFKIPMPSGASFISVTMYGSTDCSGSSVWSGAATSGELDGDISGSSANDAVNSFQLAWTTPTAGFVSWAQAGNVADPSYYLSSNALTSATKFAWYRASSKDGQGATLIDTTENHPFAAADSGQYLEVCVTPSVGNGIYGSQSCSTFVKVGHLVGVTVATNSYSSSNSTIVVTATNTAYFPYELIGLDTCVNVNGYLGNDSNGTAYPIIGAQVYAETSSDTSAAFFVGTSCGGSPSAHAFASAGGSGTMSMDVPQWSSNYSLSFKVLAGVVPSASNVAIALSNTGVTGSYSFSDPEGMSDSSSLAVERSDSGTGDGTNVKTEATATSYSLQNGDNGKYLRFCVTPQDDVGFSGSRTCSGWVSVGHVLNLWSDSGQVTFAYESRNLAGTCVNLSSYSFNDKLTSGTMNAESGADAAVLLYKDANCSGTMVEAYATSGGSASFNFYSSNTSFNKEASSFVIAAADTPSASNISIKLSGINAIGSYTFSDPDGLAESGTSTHFVRETNTSGYGLTAIDYGTTTHQLVDADNAKYLQFAVRVQNIAGFVAGETSSNNAVNVGHLLTLYKDTGETGTTESFPYENGDLPSCVNLTSYSFGGVLTSAILHAEASSNTTVVFFSDTACSSSTSSSLTVTAGSSGTVDFANQSFNDKANSFRIVTSDTPSVSNLKLSVSGYQVSGSYSFSDPAGLPESGSTYAIQRGSSTSDTNPTTVSTSTSYTLTTADDQKYLRFCVNGTDAGGFSTGQQCSTWVTIGHLLTMYKDSNESGTSRSYPWEILVGEHGCKNLDALGFDNVLSSFTASGQASYQSSVVFFDGSDCTGTSWSQLVSANQTVSANVSSSFNDTASSFYVIYNDTPTVSNPAVTISGNLATGTYSYSDPQGLSESGSSILLERADTSVGGGTVTGLSVSSTHTLSINDNNKYIRVCVTPMNSAGLSGSKSCSSWTSVGPTVTFYQDASYGGSSVTFAYKGTSWGQNFNLTDYGFNDKMSSYKFFAPSSGAATLWLYQDINGGGASKTDTVSAGSERDVSQVDSGWNDYVSSFKVTW